MRHANLSGSSPLVDPNSLSYAQALTLNPFQMSLSDGEQDEVDEELLENTRRNSVLGSQIEHDRRHDVPDNVKATLASFARLPRRPAAPPASRSAKQNELNTGRSSRPALDIDAFKRLLLTGVSTIQADGAMSVSPHTSSPTAVASDSSSSNTDTASVSQQSMFDPPAPIITETPRTSQELDREGATSERGVLIAETTPDRKPPVPRPRHGKALGTRLTSAPPPNTHSMSQGREPIVAFPAENLRLPSLDMNKPLPPPPIDNSSPPAADSPPGILQTQGVVRRPPTPPLTRGGSQHRTRSLRESFDGFPKTPSDACVGAASSPDQHFTKAESKAPPPPPSRRQKRANGIGLKGSGATVQGEDSSCITSTQPQLSPTSSMTTLLQLKPQTPPSTNPSVAKGVSPLSTSLPTMAPPFPPPRRVRGSSRSSFDSQNAASNHDPVSSSESGRPSAESSRNVSDPSVPKDVLADLAALQVEVDTLRKKQRA